MRVLLSKRKVIHFMLGKVFAQCVRWLRIPSGMRKKRDCSLRMSYAHKLLHNFVLGNMHTPLEEMLEQTGNTFEKLWGFGDCVSRLYHHSDLVVCASFSVCEHKS
jgi:hypothetical protein